MLSYPVELRTDSHGCPWEERVLYYGTIAHTKWSQTPQKRKFIYLCTTSSLLAPLQHQNEPLPHTQPKEERGEGGDVCTFVSKYVRVLEEMTKPSTSEVGEAQRNANVSQLCRSTMFITRLLSLTEPS